ncbi:MAG: hypothetical protein QOC64_907, partial [Solirubrobacteraceae bacterium]|nr:hypothetical protein [Solirubrobacteraceae bacterium]
PRSSLNVRLCAAAVLAAREAPAARHRRRRRQRPVLAARTRAAGARPARAARLVFLLRCLLDPLSTIHYHAPFLLALLAWEGERRGRVPLLTLLASPSLWCVWRSVAPLDLPALTNAVYLAWALPMAALLTPHAFGLSHGRLPRAAGVPSAQAVQA